MKSYFKHSALVLFAASLFVGSASAKELKIATVNTKTIFQKYYRGAIEIEKVVALKKKAEEVSELESAKITALKAELDELKKIIDDTSSSKEAKDSAAKQFETKRKKGSKMHSDFVAAHNRRVRLLASEQKEVTESLRDEVIDLVRKYAEDQGYDLVFDQFAVTKNVISSAVYVKQSTDITFEALEFVNSGDPSKKTAE